MSRHRRCGVWWAISAALLVMAACGDDQATATVTPVAAPAATPAASGEITSRGSIEVTARLVEIPEGAIIKRDLYDYTAVLKYEVITVHRGTLSAKTIYVGHYNPFKPRGSAADKRVKDIGGTLERFTAGALHRMALDTPLDDHYLGGVIDKYFGQHQDPIHWAVWTDAAP